MKFTFIFSFLVGAVVLAATPVVPEQYSILRFEKNENPQNILIAYTQLNSQCHLLPDLGHPHLPVLDFYWLMDGHQKKPVNALIKHEIRRRIKMDAGVDLKKNPDAFLLVLTEVEDIQPELKGARLLVEAHKKEGGCEVIATLQTAKDEFKNMQITKIYSESKKTFLPPFRKIMQIQIEGKDFSNHRSSTKTYKSR